MNVDGRPTRTLWPAPDGLGVVVIDQTRLPHRFETRTWRTLDDAAQGIATMVVRGAPLIGVSAAYGLALGLRADPSDAGLETAARALIATRPTAVNLRWAVERVSAAVRPLAPSARADAAWDDAGLIAEEDVAACAAIGRNGAALIAAAHAAAPSRPVNVLTHCNAGWLAAIDWGTALAPIYAAQANGIPLHVWVDETRPRNQGAALTAWELGQAGIDHTVIVDNAGGYLMRAGRVDLCITGADRVAANGDACNKIGTYLKALAAHDTGVAFHVAFPESTIDWRLPNGDAIPIEERGGEEVSHMTGLDAQGALQTVRITPQGSPVANWAFDVTPARLITSLITERGVCPATTEGLQALYDRAARPAHTEA
jgi:methylthioribose-1-phosphate isomerase